MSETFERKRENTLKSENPNQKSGNSRLYILSLAALGVVYGDIGTSPLYAIRECFHGDYGIEPSHANVLGVLSLIFWSLLVIVSIKYITLMLRADNHGEGGVFALTSLIRSQPHRKIKRKWVLVGLGLFGASLLYGDGMITPAISVLSAVEGLHSITPAFKPLVIPATVLILAFLFLFQRHGTAKVGGLFGPVTFVWFCVIGVLGIHEIIRIPEVLLAVDPRHGALFLVTNRLHGFIVLGAVFLVVTGAEALYADMGHFGPKPIRTAWFAVVLPALLLNYFGQGALLLHHPEMAHGPFYALVPEWSIIPMVLLATAATIIASQAVISGAFSLTRQAIQMGYVPRLQIIHTSPTEQGQIYIPQINWLLMITTIGLVLGFQESSKLAAAYGVAVTTTMLIATTLFYMVARNIWQWSRLKAGIPTALFYVFDISFFAANLGKIMHGAWFPLVIGGIAYILMTTWKKGRQLLGMKIIDSSEPLKRFLQRITDEPPQRVPGKAIFLASNPGTVPPAMQHNLEHNRILHEQVAILSITTEDRPRVPRDDKVEIQEVGAGFYTIRAHFGFMEGPNVPYILAIAREKGLDFELEETSFFLGRERLLAGKEPGMHRWRNRIFAFMARNAVNATAFFHIPPEQVIELGAQIEI